MDQWMLDAYHNAKMTVFAFERMMELEEENAELQKKLKGHEDRVNRMFKDQMESIGNTLSSLASK